MEDNNHDDLITQFKDITGANTDRARFYLESADWCLQIAISSFYEGEFEGGHRDTEASDEMNEEMSMPPGNNSDTDKTTDAKPSSDWKTNASKRFATLHTMGQKSSDEEEEQGQAFYAGGSERSGQQVLGPPKQKDFREKLSVMLRNAQESGAVVAPEADLSASTSRGPQYFGSGVRLGQTESDHVLVSGDRSNRSSNTKPVILKFWSQGFSVNDSELRPYDDPANRDFLSTVMKREIPAELRQMGNVVSVDIEDRRHEDYRKPSQSTKTFKGSGHTLGSPAPNLEPPVSTPEESVATNSNNETPSVAINSAEPVTQIQIRLADGSRINSQFNHSHTIDDIRGFITASRPQYQGRNFVLVTAFPTKELSDGSQSIEQAGLLNASLMQRLK